MILNLQIQYDTETGSCNVGGFPVQQLQDGTKQVAMFHCDAALATAKRVLEKFDPNATGPKLLIAQPGEIPPAPNRINHRQ